MVRHCGLCAHAVALCRRTDHVTRWMFLHVPFDVLPVYKLASCCADCSSTSTPELIITRHRESVSSALLTLASPLSLDVRSGFGAGKKTEPHRTETAVFPQTKPKLTDLGHSETVRKINQIGLLRPPIHFDRLTVMPKKKTSVCPPLWPYASQHYPTDNNFLLHVFCSPTLSYVTYQRQLTVIAATD